MSDVPSVDIARVREIRATEPEAIGAALASRSRRPLIQGDGKLFIVAADHTARGALGVRGDSLAMSDRGELLRRLVVALERPGVDGVLGTPDILEDLALLGALDNKIVVGSMNRGGLQGASFEMDDRFTACSAQSIVEAGFDFAKLLVRINLADAGTADTIEASAHAVSEAASLRLPIMLEPFVSDWVDGRIRNDLSTEAVIKSIAIASGLGESTAYSWLKLPVVDDMERVMAATTLPTVLLGGDPSGTPVETYSRWANALAQPGVRGLTVGRALLYPADDDVANAVDISAGLVHATLPAQHQNAQHQNAQPRNA